MQLAQTGRNEPCPCGSGRKYKKCCLGAPDAAAARAPNDLDVAALVDRAIAGGDWEPVHEVFDRGFVLFEPLGPLEHVRFRCDLVAAGPPSPSEYARLCEGGWLRYCEREIGYVLDRHALEEGERDGLRLAVHMVRRFGAKSPVVESIAALQAQEYRVHMTRFTDALARRGLSVADIDATRDDFVPWLERVCPAVLPFADWFALRAAPDDDEDALWLSAIAMRVCDVTLARLDSSDLPDPIHWLSIAARALAGDAWLGDTLVEWTPAGVRTDDEQLVYTALSTGTLHADLQGSIARIIEANAARGDFAGAALLRQVQQRVRMLRS
jgi:hypothetical protein